MVTTSTFIYFAQRHRGAGIISWQGTNMAADRRSRVIQPVGSDGAIIQLYKREATL